MRLYFGIPNLSGLKKYIQVLFLSSWNGVTNDKHFSSFICFVKIAAISTKIAYWIQGLNLLIAFSLKTQSFQRIDVSIVLELLAYIGGMLFLDDLYYGVK